MPKRHADPKLERRLAQNRTTDISLRELFENSHFLADISNFPP